MSPHAIGVVAFVVGAFALAAYLLYRFGSIVVAVLLVAEAVRRWQHAMGPATR